MRVALDPVLGEAQLRRSFGGRMPQRLVLNRPGLTIVFRRMEPHAAVQAFRRGELDEAPVPQGEIRAVEADPVLSQALRARELRGMDVVVFPPGLPDSVLQAYRLTAPRADYQQLIAERVARAAEPASAGDFRKARASIRTLPHYPLAFGIPQSAELAEAAELVWAEWRQLGLPLRRVPEAADPDVRLVRMAPPLRRRDNVVALGWIAEARLVSPRVRGWQLLEDGTVDYSRVRLEPGP
jgi:hypothetical protein